jgi:hypothetical protein
MNHNLQILALKTGICEDLKFSKKMEFSSIDKFLSAEKNELCGTLEEKQAVLNCN